MSEDQKQSIRRAFDAVKIGVPPVIIELRWGYAPRDLDSHLTGPTVDGSGRFHIYFSNKAYTADS